MDDVIARNKVKGDVARKIHNLIAQSDLSVSEAIETLEKTKISIESSSKILHLEERNAVIRREIEQAREKELFVGIDPESYLGKEISKTGIKVTELDRAIRDLTSSVKAKEKLKYDKEKGLFMSETEPS
ncbi:hypothetical protein [Paenibacillus alvei]|uniref:hypothetical protein n=1 Tax=Paenibacillus alvei TaxID=44250 RepID=UPI0013DC7944|nr:hypothetical protein [Paenibacillus alvei]NEZ44519.1 hypothetical protein [Paenibacillus alvei]